MRIRLVFGIKNKYVELTKKALEEEFKLVSDELVSDELVSDADAFTVYVFSTPGRFQEKRLRKAVELIKKDTEKTRKGIVVVIGNGSEALPKKAAFEEYLILCTAVRVPVSNNPTQFEKFKKEFIAAINNNTEKTIEVLTKEQMAEYQEAQEAKKMAKRKAKRARDRKSVV